MPEVVNEVVFGQPPWLSGNVLEAKTSSSTVTLQLLPPTHVCCHAASWSAISCTIWCNLVIGVKYRKLGLAELPPDWPGVVDYSCITENSCFRFSGVAVMQYMDILFFHIVDLNHSAVPWPGGKFCRLVPACASRLPVLVQKYILSRFSALEYVFTEWQLSMVIESVLLLSLML